MNRRQVLVGAVAALWLAAFGWANWPTADAATQGNTGTTAARCVDCGCCCDDPACPPGCSADCPPDCAVACRQALSRSARPVVSEAVFARFVASKKGVAPKKCGPNGCCTA